MPRFASLIGAAVVAASALGATAASAQNYDWVPDNERRAYQQQHYGYGQPSYGYQQQHQYAAPPAYGYQPTCYYQRYQVHTYQGYQWRQRRVCH